MGQARKNLRIQIPPPHLRPGTTTPAVPHCPHACNKLYASLCATCAHNEAATGVTSSRRRGGEHTHERAEHAHTPCAHGYRPAGETTARVCTRGMHDRRATPAATCACDACTGPTIPAVMGMRQARGMWHGAGAMGTTVARWLRDAVELKNSVDGFLFQRLKIFGYQFLVERSNRGACVAIRLKDWSCTVTTSYSFWTDERTVDRSKDRSKDRRMRTRGDKRPSRKNDRKVLMAEESTKSWAGTDSDSSSSSSSSSDSEHEEVHCLMADQTSDDEAYSKFIYQSEMASSLFINTVHVCFESVLAMDNFGMVAMFESLVHTGLKGFLGCPAVIHEAALLEFFANGSVRDGLVVSTVNGVTVEISEQLFAETFELPVEGLTDLLEIPKDLVFDARSIILCLVGMEVVTAEPRVKKTPTKKATKRPATDAAVAPVDAVPLQMVAPTPVAPPEQPSVPKRKTQKRKRKLILNSNDDIVDSEPVVGGSIVGEEAVKVVDDTAEKAVEPIVESVEEQQAETTVGISEAVTAVDNVDDVDVIIEQVIAETAQLETDEENMLMNQMSIEQLLRIKQLKKQRKWNVGLIFLMKGVEKSADESMSLEDILMTIPAECPLSSPYVEITKIILGKTISIPGVNEGDWYKASLPKIPAADKGKAPLLERDPVKGNPIKEQFSLILADIEVLVMLREKIIEDVDRFFNSFSLKRLATLKIDESYFDKEALILSWAKTDSTRVALNRWTYILTKYRELLIRKFLEARKINFTPGEGSSATDLKVMEMLSDLHLFVVEDLKEQTMAHGLKWENTYCSKIFEGRPRDPGAIIARTNTNTRSTCWIRTMIRVDGVWVIEHCGDHWVKIPREVVNNEFSRQRSYEDTLPPESEFFRIMRKRWADVCLALTVVEPVFVFVSRQSPVISWRLSQLYTDFIRYSLFSSLSTADIRSFVSTIAFERKVFRDVQIVQSSVSAIPSVQSSFASADRSYVQLLLEQHPQSPSTTADSSMHFDEDDTQLEDVSDPDQYISTFYATAVTTSIDALRESFSNFVATQSKDSRQTNNALGEVMNKIYHVKRVFLDSIAEHNETFRGLFKRRRQEAQNDNNALSLALKAVRNQNVILSTDLEATRKEVRDIKAALSKDFDDKLADIRNKLLEFRVETQGQLASLSTHLAELIAFLTKGSDDKRGKVVAATPSHLLTIKADPTGEMVEVAIEQKSRADTEVEVVVEAIGVDLPREDIPAEVVDRSGDRLKIG
ncbi:splicing factor, proline- and glutamine-rich-like [Dorcoceras hygrometricum]|uniref:Splicing factor, proline-and glutamine-rich-like n=1 Tax=Dorcoceras hygrometricum TaxID=472368 RepID=A0A2Z7A986_9LAMI|nr:splicing factor, proline- and glutamine-rich-like [Dorcoceras hygrometricum]